MYKENIIGPCMSSMNYKKVNLSIKPMSKNIGVISMGIKTPIIREGDDLAQIVVNAVLDATRGGEKLVQPAPGVKGLVKVRGEYFYDINDKDVIGITESVVARSVGNYVSLYDIGLELRERFGSFKKYYIVAPIYSRNRFSMILKAIAGEASEVIIYMPEFDEVGNPSGVNQFTGVNIRDYYKEIVEAAGAKCIIFDDIIPEYQIVPEEAITIYCGLHDYEQWKADYGDETHITLADICKDKCEYGLLGSNKANENTLKLFPDKKSSQELVEKVQARIYEKTNKYYGDGCFKDPVGGIWEFADPVASPAYTIGLEGRPNEIKIKAFADDKYSDLNGEELNNAIKNEIKLKAIDLKGNMSSQGTTPRRYVDLLASLMDLTSGSGDKGTPVILVKNYFKNFSNE